MTACACGLVVALLALAPAVVPAAVAARALTLVTQHEPGVPLTLLGAVRDRHGAAIAGAHVHVYQADATGRYTPARPMDEPHARLAGWIDTDADGRFELHTIRPGHYPRTLHLAGADRRIPAHIHVDVTVTGHPERRVQVVFADDPELADAYWQDWVRRLRQPVVTLQAGERGSVGSVTIVLD